MEWATYRQAPLKFYGSILHIYANINNNNLPGVLYLSIFFFIHACTQFSHNALWAIIHTLSRPLVISHGLRGEQKINVISKWSLLDYKAYMQIVVALSGACCPGHTKQQ